MRIAIIGTGISGLTAAHLLHPEHEIVVYEAGDHVGGHANTVRVDTDDATWHVDTGFIVLNDRNYPHFEALLDELGVARQPTNMSFSVSARTRTSSTPRAARAACSPSRRTSRDRASCGWSPTTALQPRGARPDRDADDDRSLGDFLADGGYSRLVHRAPDRAPGLRGVVGRPGADLVVPGRASWPQFFAQPRDALAHRAPAVAHDRRRLRALRRGAHRALRRPHPRSRTPVARGHAPPDARRGVAATAGRREFDEVVIAAHADQALAMLDRPHAPRARAPGRLPLPAQRGRPAHRRALLPRRRRAWAAGTSTCSPSPRPLTTVTYHMNRLQAPRRRPAVLRDAEPHATRSTRAGHPRRSPTRTRSSRGGRSPRRAATRRSAASSARTTAAPTGAGAFTRTASERAARRVAAAHARARVAA